MGKFDDKGFLGPNQHARGSDRAPHVTGVINFSKATVRRLKEAIENGEDAKIQIAGWRNDDDPKKISLKISEPLKKDGDGYNRRGASYNKRDSNKSYSDDDNDRRSNDRGGRRDDRDDRGRRQDDDFPGDRKMQRNRYDEPDDEPAW